MATARQPMNSVRRLPAMTRLNRSRPNLSVPKGCASEGGSSEPPTGSLTQQVRTLLTQASADYEAADAALKAGDLQEYADRTAAAEAKVAKALELLNGDQGQQG